MNKEWRRAANRNTSAVSRQWIPHTNTSFTEQDLLCPSIVISLCQICFNVQKEFREKKPMKIIHTINITLVPFGT